MKLQVRAIPKYGDTGTDVTFLQQQLNSVRAEPKLTVDGEFGPLTKKAVSFIQKKNGLPGSGNIGPKTLEILGLELASVVTPPTNPNPNPGGTISSGTDPDEGTEPWYRRMMAGLQIDIGMETRVQSVGKTVLKNKERYAAVAKIVFAKAVLPEGMTAADLWYVLGLIHYKEASCNFAGVLHNGERIIGTGKKTSIVPKGRGPFSTWEEAAIDAMNGESLGKLTNFELGSLLKVVERYNGTGYITGAGKGDTSAYLWACTNVNDDFGKYVSDGKWDGSASVQSSPGFCAGLKWLEDNGHIKVIRLAGTPAAPTTPVTPVPSTPAPVKPGAKVTRQMIADAILVVINKDIDAKLRETHGKNRSPKIDEFNKRAKSYLGAPYCASGGWCAIDDACKALGLKNPVRPTASSQDFRRSSFIPAKYFRPEGALGMKGDVGVFQASADAAHGHHTTLDKDQAAGTKTFYTSEYNTGSDGGSDGDGAYHRTRNTIDRSKENAGKNFVCFTDVPQFILDYNS